MGVLSTMADRDFEQVVLCHDRASGLRSVIAIHDTRLGPALGGVRMRAYESEDAAIEDCLRLARGMTYKAAAAGLHQGGGKSVIIGDPTCDKSDALLRAHGRFVDGLGGRYVASFDLGTSPADVRVMAQVTSHVAGLGEDPSPFTALGAYAAIRACLRFALGTADVAGRRIAIQGVGHVGTALARLTAADGARLVLADLDTGRAEALARELGAATADADEIVAATCDVLAPCATGAVIDDSSIRRLRCRIVAGAANNVLAEPRHGEALHAAGILYAPDFVANAGGIVLLDEERLGHDPEHARRRVRGIEEVVGHVLGLARLEGIAPAAAAELLAERRLATAG